MSYLLLPGTHALTASVFSRTKEPIAVRENGDEGGGGLRGVEGKTSSSPDPDECSPVARDPFTRYALAAGGRTSLARSSLIDIMCE
jgi:hypothetical protein